MATRAGRARAVHAALTLPALAAVTVLATAGTAQATMASSTYDHQNTTCADISEHLKEVKVEGPEEGTHGLDDGYMRGSYTVTEGKKLDWSSDRGTVKHVLVKGGDGTNRYDYDGSDSAVDLYAPDNASGYPADVSHFKICYEDDDRGHVKIVKKAMPADTYERFAFSGSYGLTAEDFELAHDEEKLLRPKPGEYTLEEKAKDGWEVDYIACEDSDPYGKKSWGEGRTAMINVESDEYITCTFYNKKVYKPEPEAPMPPEVAPPAVVTPMTSAPAPVAARPAAIAVKATTVARGAAGLRRARGCVSRTVRVTVNGSPIGRIVFAVDGRRVKTVAAARGQRTYAATLPVGTGRVHRVTARVSFTNGARSRTLRTTVVRCAQQQVAPQFTG